MDLAGHLAGPQPIANLLEGNLAQAIAGFLVLKQSQNQAKPDSIE